jgi:hypothetical protein
MLYTILSTDTKSVHHVSVNGIQNIQGRGHTAAYKAEKKERRKGMTWSQLSLYFEHRAARPGLVPLAELNLTKPFQSAPSLIKGIEPSPGTYSCPQDTEKMLSFERNNGITWPRCERGSPA